MGNYWSNDFYIYARKKDSDSYELLHTITEGNPMSRFKHEVYAYSLLKRYKDMKSLYLYWGSSRVAKALMVRNDILYLELDFASDETASDWDQCQEQIQNAIINKIISFKKKYLNIEVEFEDELKENNAKKKRGCNLCSWLKA